MAHGLQRMLAELDITAQRPVKERPSEFVSSEPSTRRRSGPWISAIALTYGQP